MLSKQKELTVDQQMSRAIGPVICPEIEIKAQTFRHFRMVYWMADREIPN
jgi:hypothetical protein